MVMTYDAMILYHAVRSFCSSCAAAVRFRHVLMAHDDVINNIDGHMKNHIMAPGFE